MRRWLGHGRATVGHALLLAGAFIMLAPFLWMALTALKTEREIYTFPPVWIPTVWDWANFPEALAKAPFGRYFYNSLVMAVAQTGINVVFAAMAGYAFARLRFRGRDFLFWLVLAKMAVPVQVTLIPSFLVVKHFPLLGGNNLLGQGGTGMLNSYPGLIVPGAVTGFAIFLFRQFFSTLPRDLEDAARIDGCSEWHLFWRIMLPLAGPALAVVAIFTFQDGWNAFLWPLVITRSEAMRTIQVGLTVFQEDVTIQWDYLMAGTTLATLPVMAVFILFQRYFIRGISMSGLKG